MLRKESAGVPSSFKATASGLSTKAFSALFTLLVDSRPWWHSRHRLALTGTRLPLSSFSVEKVNLAPLGNGTVVTAYRAGQLAASWQVVHMKPLAVGWLPMPETVRDVPARASVPPLWMNSGRPVALWHLAQPNGTSPASSQSRKGMVLPAKWPASMR